MGTDTARGLPMAAPQSARGEQHAERRREVRAPVHFHTPQKKPPKTNETKKSCAPGSAREREREDDEDEEDDEKEKEEEEEGNPGLPTGWMWEESEGFA